MWAHRLIAPGRFEAVKVEAPRAADLMDGQVLLRTTAGGVCASDAPRFRGLADAVLDAEGRFCPGPPGYPMHEVAGEVVASRDPAIRVGSRVAGWATGVNALAEFVVTAGDEVVEHDPSFDPVTAVLVQSVACVMYAVDRLPVNGASVAVLGLGPFGLLFAHVLRSAGAGHITGIDLVDRSGVADAFGVDRFIHSGSAMWSAGLREDQRPDVVIEAVGRQTSTLQHAIAAAAAGGTVCCFGVPADAMYAIDMVRFMDRGLTLIGGTTRRRREMLVRADAYLATHRDLRDALVTHVYLMEEAQEAYNMATVASPDRRKVIVVVDPEARMHRS